MPTGVTVTGVDGVPTGVTVTGVIGLFGVLGPVGIAPTGGLSRSYADPGAGGSGIVIGGG